MQKFGQRPDQKSIEYLDMNTDEFLERIYDESIELVDFRPLDADTALVTHRPLAESIKWARGGNVAVGVYTTAYARVRLWRLLHQLGDRVIYYDTGEWWWRRRTCFLQTVSSMWPTVRTTSTICSATRWAT